MKKFVKFKLLVSFILSIAMIVSAASAFAEPWKFGVMGDTQWTTNTPDNPGTVAVGIINQINARFIGHGVKFVLQAGDLDDKETNYSGLPGRIGISTRAAAAQPLYDAGIGFWPVRGNHEGSALAAVEVQNYFPQTRTVATGGTEGAFTKTDGTTFTMGANFSSPFASLNGLSYSFTYNNATFMLLDQFTRTDNTNYLGSTNNNIIDQQPWISSTLGAKPADSHAFVITHKNLIGGNHTDTMFNRADRNPDAQNAFIASLDAANVGYFFSGHDHMHNRSIITSPDGASQVRQIITASDSHKFYTPSSLSAHGTDTVGYNAGQISKNRELEIGQELWSTGYYIVTVDGPRVTVDFYAADPDTDPGLWDRPDLTATPNLTFTKRETFGYSLNGQDFKVAQGGSYTAVSDSFGTTSMQILSGTNGSTGADYNGRALTKTVNTGWTPKNDDNLRSDILTLWGMEDSLSTDLTGTAVRNGQTDTYTLSMSYEKGKKNKFGEGTFGIAAQDADGNWVNAVSLNSGGTVTFVEGPWNSSYGLGTYGVDTDTKTVWAVVNYNGNFAVSNGL